MATLDRIMSRFTGQMPTINPGAGRLSPYAGYSMRAMRSSWAKRPEPKTKQTQARSRPWGRMSSGFKRGPVTSRATAQRPKRLWDYSFRDIAPAHTTLGGMRERMGAMRTTYPRYSTWT